MNLLQDLFNTFLIYIFTKIFACKKINFNFEEILIMKRHKEQKAGLQATSAAQNHQQHFYLHQQIIVANEVFIAR